jgi:hypothetical protein
LIGKIYKTIEEKYTSALRVILVFATLITLLVAIGTYTYGFILSKDTHDVKTEILASNFADIDKLMFKQQITVLEEEEDEEDEEEEKVPPRIKSIHDSMKKQFIDSKANREQFKELFDVKQLQAILDLMRNGQWRVGNNAGQFPVTLPNDNKWNCNPNRYFTSLNAVKSDSNEIKLMKIDQYNQLLDQMVVFWKDAERGTADNSSAFMKLGIFENRVGQIIAANDLLLCSFQSSLEGLDQENAKEEGLSQMVQAGGMALMAGAAYAIDIAFKFFAAFALVIITLILYRIQKSYRS